MTFKRHGLVQRRKAAGLSQEGLAAELGVERSTIHRWECGDTEPQPSMRPRIANRLGVSLLQLDELLNLQTPGRRSKPDVSGSELGPAGEASIAVGLPHDRAGTRTETAAELSIPTRLGADDVRYIEHANDFFDRSDFMLGGDAGFRAALAQLEWGQRALEGTTMMPSVRRELQRVLARLANRAGFMCFDAGNHGTARTCFQAALALSAEACDWQFRTNILESMCHQAISIGRPAEAIGFCSMAEASPLPPPPNIHSLLNVMSAWGYAIMGDVYATKHQLAKASDSLASCTPGDLPEWSWWFDPADTEGKIGRVLCELAKHQSPSSAALLDEACASLEKSTRRHRPEIARTNTLNLAKYAEVRMLRGDVEEAAKVTRQVLTAAASIRSIRITKDLRDLLSATQRHSDTDVANLREGIELTLESLSST